MRDPLGGYIFLPAKKTYSLAGCITYGLEILSDYGRIKSVWTIYEGKYQHVPLEKEAALEALIKVGYGSIRLYIAGLPGWINVDKNNNTHQKLGIQIDAGDIAPPPTEFAERVDDFVERWLRLCEKLQADYAYFLRYTLDDEDVYRDMHVIPALGQEDIKKLFDTDKSWLLYFGSRILAQVKFRSLLLQQVEGAREYFEQMTIQEQNSESILIRTGFGPLDV